MSRNSVSTVCGIFLKNISWLIQIRKQLRPHSVAHYIYMPSVPGPRPESISHLRKQSWRVKFQYYTFLKLMLGCGLEQKKKRGKKLQGRPC